ncbi:MAG: nucleotidyltransferase domain-containing protein [Veillonellales bacterium]
MGANLAGKKRNDRLLQVLTPFLLSRTEIQFAWLFGSYATGRNTASSDIDIAIFVNDLRLLGDTDWYLGLKSDLMALTHKEIDLILLNNAKPLMKHAANMKKIVLLARDPLFEAEYALSVIKEYNDVRYWAQLSRQRLLGGAKHG